MIAYHFHLHARFLQTSAHVLHALDVAIGKHRNPDRIAHRPNVRPIGQAGQRSLLVARAAMHRQQLGACLFQHLRVAHRFVAILEHAYFARHRHRQFGVQQAHDFGQQVPLVLQVCAVVAALCDRLRTAQIDVDRVTVVLGEQGGRQQRLRIVAAELNDQRPIGGAALQRLLAVFRVQRKVVAVEHGGVAQLGAVSPAEQPPGELRLVDHGSDDQLGGAQDLLVELPSVQFWLA